MKLKEFRKNLNMTQSEVAKLLQVAQTSYCHYESGLREPDIETLCKLATLYHTTIDELVGRDTDMINLNTLEPEVSTLIRKIIKMNDIQKAQTINFVGALTMFDN